MSYRDWDQHDRRWPDEKSNVRRRENDEEGGWDPKKRRRYEDESYNDKHEEYWQEDSQRPDERDDWKTRPAASVDDAAYYQGKPHMKGKRIVASEASQHVIFLGLDTDFVESDLLQFLQSFKLNPESVTIIRDRITGLSKGFGFAQFASTKEAQAFVEPNFPFIMIPPPQSHGASAALAFANGTGQHLGRRVKIDYSQSAQGSGPRMGGGRSANDGTRDIGNSPCSTVLLRGLDPMSTLDVVTEALRSSAGPNEQGAKGMKRIILVRDKYTAMGIGLAFVEFVDSESAAALLAATMSAPLHPEGFRISNRPVAASFANPVSFQTLPPHALRDEACIVGSTALGGTEGAFAKYWDENASVVEKEFEVMLPLKKEPAPKERKKKKASEREAMTTIEIDEFMRSAVLPDKTVSTTLPTNLKPLTLSLGKLGSQNKLASRASTTNVMAAFSSADPDEPEVIPDNKPVDKAMTFRRVAPLIASKKVANSINKWNEVSQELRQPSAVVATTSVVMPQAQINTAAPQQVLEVTPEDLEFCVLQTSSCYLCARQLKSQEQLKRHVKESDLHKKNLANEALRQTAREKVAKAQGQENKGSTSNNTNYRDRASERRIMHGQPDVPFPDVSTTSTLSKKAVAPVIVSSTPAAPPKEPAKDENNIGNKLLKKMGWSEGTGLGLSGEGRIDPVQTALYAAGAGLGASKGKDITKIADLDYAGLARESAKDRYAQ